MFDGIFSAASESIVTPTPRAATPTPSAVPLPSSDDAELIDFDEIPLDNEFEFEEL
jgi:hypothetical protein